MRYIPPNRIPRNMGEANPYTSIFLVFSILSKINHIKRHGRIVIKIYGLTESKIETLRKKRNQLTTLLSLFLMKSS
jgi:hypothetical protein